ncbi:MAG: hypothetical protein FWH26_01610 [Oscillospiraceae bacterium]|nr:hypothetical protein [Oscillospiraceae bacterium]
MEPKVSFRCSDPVLQEGFAWAKGQAMAYVRRTGDPVGPWYEAALPERDAFCVRDTAHQRAGAAILGLADCTYNMLRRFCESIHPDRDDCMYWEIEKSGRPAPVDYTNDQDFWYNLPANFDLLQACWREYLWTGDARYIEDEVFLRCYETSCTRYLARWDRDGDGWPEHLPADGRRGIASYNEQGRSPYRAADLLGAMFAGFRAYAEILRLRGEAEQAERYTTRADQVRAHYLGEWYDAKRRRFFGAMKAPGQFRRDYYDTGHYLPVWFGLLDGSPLLGGALSWILAQGPNNVEGKSYFPAIYYGRGLEREGLRELRELCVPGLKRRDYPEVSFAVISSAVEQYMGITVPAPNILQSCPALEDGGWAELQQLPVFGGSVSIRQEGQKATTLKLLEGSGFIWRACFPGEFARLLVDGQPRGAAQLKDAAGRTVSYVDISPAGQTSTVSIE